MRINVNSGDKTHSQEETGEDSGENEARPPIHRAKTLIEVMPDLDFHSFYPHLNKPQASALQHDMHKSNVTKVRSQTYTNDFLVDLGLAPPQQKPEAANRHSDLTGSTLTSHPATHFDFGGDH